MTRQPTGARSRLLLAVVLALAAAMLAGPVGAAAETYDEQLREAEQQADRAQDELDSLSAEASGVRDELVAIDGRLADASARLRTLDGQVVLAEEELDQRTVVAEEAAADASAAAEQLDRIEARLVDQEGVLADQLAQAWIHGSTSNGPAMVYELLRTSRSPSDFAADLYRIETVLDAQAGVVTEVTDLRAAQVHAVDEARAARLRAESLRQDAADSVQLVQGLRDQAAALRADLAADRDRQATLLASLEEDAEQARAVLASVEAEKDRIEAARQAEIAAAAAAEEERRRQREAGDAAGGGSDGSGSGSGSGTSASGPCPVDGAKAERDFTNDWGYPRPGGRSHEGTDIFANRGTPVRSVGDGTVKEVRAHDGGLGGIFISIWVAEGEHWYYAHLDSVDPTLVPGVPVSDGQQVGTVGNTGNARTTPPHLHIGHYFNDVAENPHPILASRCR